MTGKKLSDYTDAWGLLCTREMDGGDSCNRTFAYSVLKQDGARALATYHTLQHPTRKGLLRRSPHPTKWYADWDRLSRDQLIPALVALARFGLKGALKSIFNEHAKHLWLFTWNTRKNFQYKTLDEHMAKSTPDVKWDYRWKLPDITGPEIWGIYARGLGRWRLLQYLGDLETLLASLTLFFQPNKIDVINHYLVLNYALEARPTLFARLASRLTPNRMLLERMDRFFGEWNEPPLNIIARERELPR